MCIAGVSLEDAITMATVNPARLLGIDLDTVPRIQLPDPNASAQ